MTAAALLLVALMANQHRVGRAVAKNAGTQYQVCISGMADGYCTAFAE